MDKTTVSNIIEFLRNEIHILGIELEGIALFGSQLTGNNTPESDIDLIIVSDCFENKNIFERANITKNAEIAALKKYHIPMDILKMTTNEFNNGLLKKKFYAVYV
ncbi:MAG TPA: nucleotidyltransferase domain-containing protein [Candidatus Kapabacteria bacterium]|nr:nucleotidyltransferase domain-containing protein [Candidatus Kapabacteria bacterium]HPO64061.1 nucleotidyltransferase domain-containing protein [Candidatus Kapabacteria bacterium]